MISVRRSFMAPRVSVAGDSSALRLRGFDRLLEQFLAFLLMRGALLLVGVHTTREDDEETVQQDDRRQQGHEPHRLGVVVHGHEGERGETVSDAVREYRQTSAQA